MSTTTTQIYFEQSWAILSTIGVINLVFGVIIIGITSISPIAIVPLVCSLACAIANGLCFYAFYDGHALVPTLVAAAFADIMWLIQEAGLSFYSYIILRRVLQGRPRVVFMSAFWSLISSIAILRVGILVCRSRNIKDSGEDLQSIISKLHIGYFVAIALVEVISAIFLLRKFSTARKTSKEVASTSSLFSYLMKSTEVRLASLALIGITRAVTYSFQVTAQSASNPAGQIDRFVYTMECMFPGMMFIDILASKLVVTNHVNSSNQSQGYGARSSSHNRKGTKRNTQHDISLYSMNHIETRIEAKNGVHGKGHLTSSQERIIEIEAQSSNSSHEYGMKGINRTVDFEIRETHAV